MLGPADNVFELNRGLGLWGLVADRAVAGVDRPGCHGGGSASGGLVA